MFMIFGDSLVNVIYCVQYRKIVLLYYVKNHEKKCLSWLQNICCYFPLSNE